MNQLKNIAEDYCKILIALEKAVAACDQQTEEYKVRLTAYETLASDRAERLLGAKTRSAHHRQRKTEHNIVRNPNIISLQILFQDMSPSQQQDAYEKLLDQVSILTSMLGGSSESQAIGQYVVDDQKNEYRHNTLPDITEEEESEAIVQELEAGQRCLKYTDNTDNQRITVAVKKNLNHCPRKGLGRILRIWPSTAAEKTVSCVHKFSFDSTLRCIDGNIWGFQKCCVCMRTFHSPICDLLKLQSYDDAFAVVSCVHKFSFDSTLRCIDGNIWGFQKCCVCMRTFHSPICDLLKLQSYDDAFAVEKNTNPAPIPMLKGFKLFTKVKSYMKR